MKRLPLLLNIYVHYKGNYMNNKPLVIGIGELLWDIMPTGRHPGGAPANFVYHAAAGGCEAYAISAVGKDNFGKELLAELASHGLDTSYIAELNDYATGTVTVSLKNGIPDYIIHENTAWDHIPFTTKNAELAKQADAVCFGSLAQRSPDSASTIQAFLANAHPDCLIVFDVNLRQNFFSKKIIERSLELADILKINDEELPRVCGMLGISGDQRAMLQGLCDNFNLKAVALTLGSDGSLYHSISGREIHSPCIDFGPVADTVGCGDSFTGALIAALLHGKSDEEAWTIANKTAGFVASRHGAMPVYDMGIY